MIELDSISSLPLSVVDRKKQQHLRAILYKAYFTNTFTISAIAKHIHTSIPSATSYINELVEMQWLREEEAKATASGRRPSIYRLNPDKKHFVIVDINTRTTTLYYVNLAHEVKVTREIPISIADRNYSETLVNEVRSLIHGMESPWAIGLSSPGLIEKKAEVNLTYLNHNVNGVSLTQWIGEQLGIQSYLINDTRASLLGEYHFGYVKNEKNVIIIKKFERRGKQEKNTENKTIKINTNWFF